jgi:methylmalonyl-CoA mutase cobalamin-binding domain/chain
MRTVLLERREVLAERVVGLLWERNPRYGERFGEEGRRKCREDVEYHMLYLADSLGAASPRLFIEYVRWVKSLFDSIDVPNTSFKESLEVMREVILEREDLPGAGEAAELLEKSITDFDHLKAGEAPHISEDRPLGTLARKYLDALLNRRRDEAMRSVLDAVEQGTDIRDIYQHVFQPTQWEIGRLWQENQVSVAQEHYCTAVTQLVMSRLYPYIFQHEKQGRVFVGTSVGDELHELGIRMIADFFELDGWDTYFLGANTPAESVVQTVLEEQADVVGISVTITYHIDEAREIIEQVRSRPELSGVKILVGGYPFNLDPELWRKVGADGTAATADGAIEKAHELVENSDR